MKCEVIDSNYSYSVLKVLTSITRLVKYLGEKNGFYGLVAQLVRAPPCHGGGRGFDPHPGRYISLLIYKLICGKMTFAES